jgi:hypothetical protein
MGVRPTKWKAYGGCSSSSRAQETLTAQGFRCAPAFGVDDRAGALRPAGPGAAEVASGGEEPWAGGGLPGHPPGHVLSGLVSSRSPFGHDHVGPSGARPATWRHGRDQGAEPERELEREGVVGQGRGHISKFAGLVPVGSAVARESPGVPGEAMVYPTAQGIPLMRWDRSAAGRGLPVCCSGLRRSRSSLSPAIARILRNAGPMAVEAHMRTATNIDFLGHSARNIAGSGGESTKLTVDFAVRNKGPAHVAGLTYTSDFWATPREGLARFQRFEGEREIWRAEVSVAGLGASFEYIIFCRDHRDFDNVAQIFNTNGGETFRIKGTF